MDLYLWEENNDYGYFSFCLDPSSSLERLILRSIYTEVLATRPAPALLELRVRSGELATNYAALLALRRLVFEEKLCHVDNPMRGMSERPC